MRSTRGALVATLAVGVLVVGAGCTGAREPGAREPGSPPPAAASGLQWQALAAGLSKRTEVAAAVTGTRVYVVGGYRGDGGTVASVEVFDTATGRWAPGPDLPQAVNHAMATSVADQVYVFGGYLANRKPSAAAYRLEPGGWREIAAMPAGRAAATAVVAGGAVHVAGGVGPDGLAKDMFAYDVAGGRWSTAPGMPTPREHLGGAGYGGRVYTVGGRTGGIGSNLNAFEVYDPGTRTWSALPPLPTPRGGLAAAATCAGHVVAVGGEAEATFPEAEAFDVRAGTWRSLPPLPTPRHGLGVAAVGARLYTFAGGPKPGLFVADTTEMLDLTPLGACPAQTATP